MTDQTPDWAHHLFGNAADDIRTRLATALLRPHERIAAMQRTANMDGNFLYGQIYQEIYTEFVSTFAALPMGETFRPKGANYRLAVVAGVLIFPWRYGATVAADPEVKPLGHPVSDTRTQVFGGYRPNDQILIPFGSADAVDEEPAALNQLAELVTTHSPVAVVAYASNPSAMLAARWGTAVLLDDGRLHWGDWESVDLGSAPDGPPKLKSVPSDDSFDRGALVNPPLRAKETAKTDQATVTGTNG